MSTPNADTTTAAAIERDIWRPFTDAYPELDVELIAGTCSDDLVHAGGPERSVLGRDAHLAEIAAFFDMVRERGDAIDIEFRFAERLHGDGVASERGVFRIGIRLADGAEREQFGRFHIFARLEPAGWRIVTDYDEGGATADEFAAAAPWPVQALGS